MQALPLTYYEILRRRNAWMFPFLSTDLDYWRLHKDLSLEEVTDREGSGYRQCLVRYSSKFTSPESPAEMEQISDDVGLVGKVFEFLLAFEHADRRLFYFAPSLAMALVFTKSNVRCESFSLGHTGLALVFDNAAAINHAYRVSKRGRTFEADDVLTVFAFECLVPETTFRQLVLMARVTNRTEGKLLLIRRLALKPGWTMEDALRTDWEKDSPSSSPEFYGSAEDKLFFDEGFAFFRMVVNSLLYLRSEDADLAQRVAVRGKDAILPSVPYAVAGQKIEKALRAVTVGASKLDLGRWESVSDDDRAIAWIPPAAAS